ncbi:phasin protein [Litoreibacter ponti]|uniref:Phasin protein n=1 Tax=Litoreibacter ponti TaxID=1510457 RepID=A0A2T6BCN4_9RHOB|nr:phasin family protein [Litoreibacter ponti]PTX53819.1 phasin protein [Litoreibacter ponti]
MAEKSTSADTSKAKDASINAAAQLQEAGLGNILGVGTAWIEAVSDMSAELAHFVAERIKEDVKTQHEILHCRNVTDLQHIQADFIQKAIDQYQAETGKLIEMGSDAFAPKKAD